MNKSTLLYELRGDKLITLEHHYGADIWTDTETDPIRKEHCLCWKCKKLTCVKETNCPTAQKLFEIAQNDSCAMMMTRCKNFVPIGDENT